MSSEDGGRWQGWKEDVGLRNIRCRVKVIKFNDLLVRVEKVLENLISSLPLLWLTQLVSLTELSMWRTYHSSHFG